MRHQQARRQMGVEGAGMALTLLAPGCTLAVARTPRNVFSDDAARPNARALKIRLVKLRNRPRGKDGLRRPSWVEVPHPPLVIALA